MMQMTQLTQQGIPGSYAQIEVQHTVTTKCTVVERNRNKSNNKARSYVGSLQQWHIVDDFIAKHMDRLYKSTGRHAGQSDRPNTRTRLGYTT